MCKQHDKRCIQKCIQQVSSLQGVSLLKREAESCKPFHCRLVLLLRTTVNKVLQDQAPEFSKIYFLAAVHTI